MHLLKPKCKYCGSTDITCDALARWSAEQQQWEVSSLLDNNDCDNCGGEDVLDADWESQDA